MISDVALLALKERNPVNKIAGDYVKLRKKGKSKRNSTWPKCIGKGRACPLTCPVLCLSTRVPPKAAIPLRKLPWGRPT